VRDVEKGGHLVKPGGLGESHTGGSRVRTRGKKQVKGANLRGLEKEKEGGRTAESGGGKRDISPKRRNKD